MRALVVTVLSATAIVAGATSASAADLSHVPRHHHARYASEPCSPCQAGWRFSPPLEWLAHGIGVLPYHYRHHRWAHGCHVGPQSCHHGWRKRGFIRHAHLGRYQLVQQKEFIGEPRLAGRAVLYADELAWASRHR